MGISVLQSIAGENEREGKVGMIVSLWVIGGHSGTMNKKHWN